MSTVETTFLEFKKLCKEFFDVLPDSSAEEGSRLFNCLTDAYLVMSADESEEGQASVLLLLAGHKVSIQSNRTN